MKNINDLIHDMKLALGTKLVSFFVYGANSTLLPQNMAKNIDSIAILENLDGNDLKTVHPYVKKWIKKGNPAPLFFDKAEWFSSADVYAMEYADIKDFNNILYGEDVISEINIERSDLRFQCELEIKNLLVKLRQFYVQNADKPRELNKIATPIVKSSIALFKAFLRLNGASVPSDKKEIVGKVSEICGLNKELFIKLLCVKEKQCKFNSKEADNISKELIKSLTEILNCVDKI